MRANSFQRLVTAWQLVVKRSLAHWRLLSSVVIGVLLASAIMSGTVVYFHALRDLALKNTLDKITTNELNILLRGERGPTSSEEYGRLSGIIDQEVDGLVTWFLKGRERAGRTATFFLATPDNLEAAGQDDARAYFAFMPGLEQRITLLPGGRMPQGHPLNAPDEPLTLEAIIPEAAAQLFNIGVGDRLAAVPFWRDVTPYATVAISGVFQRTDSDDAFWHMDDKILQASTGSKFRTVQFHVSEATFMEVLASAFQDMDSTYAWLLKTDDDKLNARNAEDARLAIRTLESRLGSKLFSYSQFTSLDDALAEHDRRLFFTKLPMFVVLVLIAVVILYYVVTLSSLVVEEQRAEIALLRSRGASSVQVLTVYVLEGVSIASAAALVGPILAGAVISLLGYTPIFSELTDSGALSVRISGGAYVMSALGGVLSFAALMIPAVRASRIGVTRHRQESARPSRQPPYQRYYLDVMLLIVGILLLLQLRDQGSVVATRLFDDEVVNHVLLAVPALILVASAMVLLRLFPLVMRAGSWLLSNRLPAGLVLGLWQMARNPTHYARLSLLLILTAGLGIFAASFGGTLQRSFEERVLYATGSDIRVEGVTPNRRGVTKPFNKSYEQVQGVERAAGVFRGGGHDLTTLFGMSYEMLAVDPDDFIQVAWFRDDFSSRPMADLLASLRHPTALQGIELPPDSRSLGVLVKPDRTHPTVTVTARIRDANDRYFSYPLGMLRSEDWRMLETNLGRSFRQPLQPVPPLTLVSIVVSESSFRSGLHAGSVLIDHVRVGTGDGAFEIIEPFDDASGWSVMQATPGAVTDGLHPSGSDSNGDAGLVRFVWSDGSARTSRGIFHGPALSPLPVLASKPFVKETGHSIGSKFQVSVRGRRVPVHLIDMIDYFPTLDTVEERWLISDVQSLTRYVNLEVGSGDIYPNEAWLATEEDGFDRAQLVEQLNSEPFVSTAVHDRAEQLAASEVDPLVEAGWRALLIIAFTAVLVLSCTGFLVHAYISFRDREVQFALLRTIGLSTRQLIGLVWLEQVLVIAVGLALGTWMGGRLGTTIMPFLGHDDRGAQVLPPFALEVSWDTLLVAYAAMAIVFAVIIFGVILFIKRISLQTALRLGEL